MTMTPAEIAADYRQAKSKLKQIGILAELNACDKETIKRILVDQGEKLPGNVKPPKPERKQEPEAQPIIKDSGERTQFSTGAVRDMHEGKGRMDLLPWLAIVEVSKHCENGAKKYGEHNVDKGIPLHSLCDSGMRHLAKFVAGMTDENHLVAAAWNILWAIQMTLTHPELVDVPWSESKNVLQKILRKYAEPEKKEGEE